ncbi:hypothetical protein [Microscilla marina]|uniref:DUF3828 domain-containing protein n=1 Tax=Microscilla marina ATCC 23134 TaxID=313606 RepID=A1ZP88_MICM2|nr:hypothetical protein [Microscilla marina]EAY27880.1 hypothetical protein M23134_00321 [Microscilla marina ATCC 23134]
MKTYSITLILTLLVWGVYAQTDTDKGWIAYKKAKLIEAKSARKVRRFKNKPGSLVTYFYASKIRQDQKWKKVLPKKTPWSRRLTYALNKYKDWTFTKFRLVSKKEHKPSKLWVKIWVEIEYKGRKDSGTDEVSLELIDGKWVIVSLPT